MTSLFRGTGANVPDIAVLGNSLPIHNGDQVPSLGDGTDFGKHSVGGGQQSRAFTITNVGSAPLNLKANSVSVSNNQSTDFVIISQPAISVATGATTTFSVRFDPSAVGPRTETISIANNDPDESPFTFKDPRSRSQR